jgi:hypothetical protein
MATTEKSITVDGTFKLKIGETEIALTREEADRLYGELFRALRKQHVYVNYPVYPNPGYIKPYYAPDYYTVGDFPPFGSGTWCSGNPINCCTATHRT